MLFSNPDTAEFINDCFEPCWQSLREVPVITVDFGGGNIVKRTLHGNIATYVCLLDGRVIDVLPGIYSAKEYRARLTDLVSLARTNPDDTMLVSYHEQKMAERPELSPALLTQLPRRVDASKRVREIGTKRLISPLIAGLGRPVSDNGFPLLEVDDSINELTRRRLIHAKLAKVQAATPNNICKWLYRDVLHANLDDPYLGLGPLLFATYPFSDESKTQ